MTSSEQAVRTAGGLSGKWHYSCFIGTLSLFVSLRLAPSLPSVGSQHFALKTSALQKKNKKLKKITDAASHPLT